MVYNCVKNKCWTGWFDMGKIEVLDEYIKQCDDVKKLSAKEKDAFIEKIVSIFEGEIPTITYRLDMYGHYIEGNEIDYDGDLDKIKGNLQNYKGNIQLDIDKRKDEIELAKQKQSNINLSAVATNSNDININISIEQVMEIIEQIPDDILGKEEKEDLEDKVSGIESAVKSGKKDKAKEKIVSVLRFLADKGADALIVMLPYLGQMAGAIQNI